MRSWALLLGGLLVWTAHFFALYGIASIFPDTGLARILTGVATLIAAAGALWLLVVAWRAGRSDDDLTRWTGGLTALGAGLALIAVLWQGLPALIV